MNKNESKQLLNAIKKSKDTKKVSKGSNEFSKKIKNRKSNVILSEEIEQEIKNLKDQKEPDTFPNLSFGINSIYIEIERTGKPYIQEINESMSVFKDTKTKNIIGLSIELPALIKLLRENNVSLEQKYGKKS
jgi:DNA repair ATPase RecN